MTTPPTLAEVPTGESTALLTDRYELTMVAAALADGTIDRPCVFELFTRRMPPGRRYAVAAGLDRAIDAIERFRFDDEVLAALARDRVVDAATLDWLAGYRFGGDVWALPEGEIVSPHVPVLTVHAGFGEAVVLETVLLSILNHDTAVASAAARMVAAADGRSLFEFGSRRTHEEAAVAAARACYLTGFTGTSNLAAGHRYGIPTLGTSAHAYTLVHDDERSAFRAQVAALGPGTTLLVDTYDIEQGLRNAVEAAGPNLGAVRIDRGDPAAEAHRARALLDTLGATGTRIVISGDLDEHRIAACADAPVDAFGVGTSVVTGAGAPTAGFVYKLVARARDAASGRLEPVAKAGGDKATVGGRKAVSRRYVDGIAVADVLHPWGTPPPPGCRPLQVEVVRAGEVVHRPDLASIRDHHAAAMASLPPDALALDPGPPALAVSRLAYDERGRPMPAYDPTTALVVVDVQNDFAHPDGGLYVTGGADAVARIDAEVRAAREAGAFVVYTQDWHPATTPHFAKDGGRWPVHGVQGTWGAELHAELTVDGPVVKKGVDGEDGYSGFSVRDPVSGEEQATELGRLLAEAGARRLVVVGLAGDVCVHATALDGRALGFEVEVPRATTAFVATDEGVVDQAIQELTDAGVEVPDEAPAARAASGR